MILEENVKVVDEILKPLRRSQRKVILLVVQGMAWMAQAASIAVAAFIPRAPEAVWIVP